MIKHIIQIRKYYPEFTESELFLPDITKKIWVLEDKKQPYGIKVDGQTCIPEGIYNVSQSFSTRFKKNMLLLSNQPDFSIQKDGVRFTGVRPHGGNTVDNTEGCPLLNFNTDHKGRQWGRASDDVYALVMEWFKDKNQIKWIITS